MLSRIAETLYWIGRYTERAEGTARLLDTSTRAALESSADSSTLIAAVLGDHETDRATLLERYALDRATPGSIAASVRAARENARTVREAITTEMWEALNTWFLQITAFHAGDLEGGGRHAFFNSVKTRAFLFEGAADATMLRDEGWHWLNAGRHLERVSFTCAVLGSRASLVTPVATTRSSAAETYGWTVLLRSLSAYEGYRRTFRSGIDPRQVTAFLLLDQDSPRSARWSAERLESAIRHATDDQLGEAARRAAGRLRADLAFREIDQVLVEGLDSVLRSYADDCNRLHQVLTDTAFVRGVPVPSYRTPQLSSGRAS